MISLITLIMLQQGHQEWLTEVNVLGVVVHPNLVKLVGYCAEDTERGMQLFLVYEYMPNGSLRDHLSPRSKTPLSWTMRLKVAQDAARGLAYLHEELDSEVSQSHILPENRKTLAYNCFLFCRLFSGISNLPTSF